MKNKGERILKQKAVFKKRLRNHNIDSNILENGWGDNTRKGGRVNFNCFRSTGKPCSCAICSPGKTGDKAKYRLNPFKKFKYHEE